jgi:lysophospholipase L1-like esterase
MEARIVARSPARRRLLLLGALALFATLTVEIAVRGRILFNEHHRFDSDGLFRYRPNTKVGKDAKLVTNNHGFFGVPLTAEKGDAYRVFILGSSAVTSPELASGVADALQKNMPDRNVEVNTAGIPRYTSYHNALLFERHILPLEPDCIVLYLGLNDNVYNTFPHLDDKPYDGFYNAKDFTRSVALDMFWYHAITKRFRVQRSFTETRSAPILEKNLRAIIESAHERGVQVAFIQMATGWPTDDEDLAAIIRANEGPMSHFWGDLDSALLGLQAHRKVIAELASEYNLAIADPIPLLPKDTTTFKDLCHLTPQGIAQLAPFIAEQKGSGL